MNRSATASVEHESTSSLGRTDACEERSRGHHAADGAVRFAPLVLAIAPFLAVAAAAALASGEDSLRATALGVLLTSLAVAGSAHRIATGGTSAGVASEGAPPKERRLEARE